MLNNNTVILQDNYIQNLQYHHYLKWKVLKEVGVLLYKELLLLMMVSEVMVIKNIQNYNNIVNNLDYVKSNTF